jgi:beta-lactamase class A
VLAAALLAAIATGLAIGAGTSHREPSTTVTVAPEPTPAAPPAATSQPATTTRPAAAEPPRRSGLRRAVAAVAAGTGAEVGAFVRPLDGSRTATAGALQTGPAWSTIKPPVVLARYALPGAQDDPRVAQLAAAALTASDNAAAQALFDDVAAQAGGVEAGSSAVEQTLRAAGDTTTHVNAAATRPEFSTYGQTSWSLADGTRFYDALARGCLAPAPAAARIVRWLREVTPSQRWGLGSVALPAGATVAFKGGWGPDPDGRYLVRQFGVLLARDGSGAAVGLIARPGDGSFETGTAVLDRLAAAVVAHARWGEPAGAAACG